MASIVSRLRNAKKVTPTANTNPEVGRVIKTSYASKKEVAIPKEFLTTTPYDAKPILTYPIDFKDTPLPEYDGHFAVVLDNVLSESECIQLIEYAEESAGSGEEGVGNKGWKAALVNAGVGKEVLAPEYRNSDRIIWDNQEVVDRIWERCLQGEGLRQQLRSIEGHKAMQGPTAVKRGEKWNMTRLNERMRFLKYGPGQFFKEHCDGSYQVPGKDERSFITLHLYLNDSVQATTPPQSSSDVHTSFPQPIPNDQPSSHFEPLQGGATPFYSTDMKRRLDVDPKAGRVLLFQHRGLLHSGDYVTSGIKYTMRTDLMYEFEFKD
ncbi:hypothetical protein CPB86DRAFT_744082 [Serendipita vermifera]|nr:hypothetical protein CPB86DRAFT_744082 [Serendipita vermifera]